jgi:hypothetical protein
MTMIYRVTVKTTGSYQPNGTTNWQYNVIYCGNDLEDARIEYLGSEQSDQHCGHGNRCRTTVIEQFDSEPDEIDSLECEDVLETEEE